ncbi:MAG: DUF4912 domain-containing protein [Verrucomicrobiales bacterium]|jgi:hypothetical protein|nr:DUF4912 domain-containing protein [Verrucomicrobiales bacterium]
MAKEPKKTATKKKSLLTRAATKLKKTIRGKKLANGGKAAKAPTKKRQPILPTAKTAKGKKIVPAAKDPVISVSAEDFDASQTAKFALETPAAAHKKAPKQKVPEYENLGELPEAYGTKKLYLTARDPHWLYAYWDLTPDQIGQAERQSHDGKVFLQVYSANGERLQQIHISPWTREWYIGANRPDQTFYAEVGYYRHDGKFEAVTRSASVTAPRVGLSWRTEARFATIPFKFSFRELAEIIRDHALPNEEVAETLARLQTTDFPLPFEIGALRHLSNESHRALLDYINGDITRRIRMGSDEITEIFRRRKDSAQPVGLDLAELSSMMGSSPSSPFGASFGAERGFRAHINAELIIYGGTEPNAKVRVDGKEIQLNGNGDFHYHFNYKDGKYHIPIEFTSPDGKEARSVLLSFLRLTDKVGEIKDTPQAPRSEPLGKVG